MFVIIMKILEFYVRITVSNVHDNDNTLLLNIGWWWWRKTLVVEKDSGGGEREWGGGGEREWGG